MTQANPSQSQSTPKAPPPLVPHLIIAGANDAIVWYERAFGAQASELARTPDGTLLHGTLEFPNGGVLFMMEAREPRGPGQSPVTIHLEVSDVDTVWKRAVDAGGKVLMPLEDQFWGARYGALTDPFGHTWSMATQKRTVPPDELERAMQTL
jgi:PhnB protein